MQADALVLSKSLALIQKTKRRVEQIDTAGFPTDSSESARTLLQRSLESLGNPIFWKVMDPESLYNTLIQLQELVQQIELSTSDRISWPLVSYCDHFWNLLFPKKDVTIFYSVFTAHNFGIHSFTHRLRLLLANVLPPSEISSITSGNEIYCLQIASLEDENLPLYANIGHEFGHALYWAKTGDVDKILASECNKVFADIITDLKASDPASVPRRTQRCGTIIFKVAVELFCDAVGALIAGPAFQLSLFEMGWGADQNTWSTLLSPKKASVKGYPSFAFRLGCLNRDQNRNFLRELQHQVDGLQNDRSLFQAMLEPLTNIPIDSASDQISVRPISDQDANVIQSTLSKYLNPLKSGLQSFIDKCWNDILGNYKAQGNFSDISGDDVFALMQRLNADILPNIVPNQTLLGRPATFPTILNASALFRMTLLSKRSVDSGSDEMYRSVQKVERLTAKALEVSYIQREYNLWDANNKI